MMPSLASEVQVIHLTMLQKTAITFR